MRTTYNGGVEGFYNSLPFGDGINLNIADQDAYHFAGQDYDPWSHTNHATFRQYSYSEGRWLQPDPYDGSYDITNPQSFNRYAYVLNNPLSLTDSSGLDYGYDCGDNCVGVVGTDDNDFECWWCMEYGWPPSGPSTPYYPPNPPSKPKVPPPPKPVVLQNNGPCVKALENRVVQGAIGAADLVLAGGKIAALAAVDSALAAATPFTGGASAAIGAIGTTYAVTSISGQVIGGVGQLYSAFTGSEAGGAMSQAGDILAGPASGLTTLAATGNLALAQTVADGESMYTGGNGFMNSNSTREALASAADYLLGSLGMLDTGCH
jgi:RHS repeat-associated protein